MIIISVLDKNNRPVIGRTARDIDHATRIENKLKDLISMCKNLHGYSVITEFYH